MSVVEPGASERRDRLKAVFERARVCTLCPLHESRTQVVFGAGHANADLMFVGEAPGANEDKLGLPFVGQAGKLLDRLLAEIGLERSDVFIANVLKCRPPGNRDPRPDEIATCHPYLREQVELIEPTVICSLGNFSTKLLRGDPTGISRLHGQAEELRLGDRTVRLLPLYHPAAALYTPSMLETLREDFGRVRELLELGPPAQPAPSAGEPVDGEAATTQEPATRDPRGIVTDASGDAPATGARAAKGAAAADQPPPPRSPADPPQPADPGQLGLF